MYAWGVRTKCQLLVFLGVAEEDQAATFKVAGLRPCFTLAAGCPEECLIFTRFVLCQVTLPPPLACLLRAIKAAQKILGSDIEFLPIPEEMKEEEKRTIKCSKCGKNIKKSEIPDDLIFETYDKILCATCNKEIINVIKYLKYDNPDLYMTGHPSPLARSSGF